jgi:hypothetical protein
LSPKKTPNPPQTPATMPFCRRSLFLSVTVFHSPSAFHELNLPTTIDTQQPPRSCSAEPRAWGGGEGFSRSKMVVRGLWSTPSPEAPATDLNRQIQAEQMGSGDDSEALLGRWRLSIRFSRYSEVVLARVL